MRMAQEPSVITEGLETLQKVDKNVIQQYLEDMLPDILNFAVQIILAVMLYLVGKRVISFPPVSGFCKQVFSVFCIMADDSYAVWNHDSLSYCCLRLCRTDVWSGSTGQPCKFCWRSADSSFRAVSCR